MKITDYIPNLASAIFMGFVIFTLGLMSVFTKKVNMYVQASAERLPPGYDYPKLTDFWVTGVSTVFFFVIEYLIKKHLYVYFIPFCKV